MRPRLTVCHVLVAWVLMMPPASGPPASAVANLAAPLAQWNLAGRFFLGDPAHDAELEKECEERRAAFVQDGKRLAALGDASVKALADAELAAKCVPRNNPELSAQLREVLAEPFWKTEFAKYPQQMRSRVMISSMLLMPPSTGALGRREATLNAPLGEWNIAGDYASPGECEQHRLETRKDARLLPVAQSVGLRPLADAMRNARCVAPDDPRANGAIPFNGLAAPPVTSIPYPEYPDEKTLNYHASDASRYLHRESDAGLRASFPGPSNETRSTSGRYVITNIAGDEEDWSLLLTDTKTKKKTLLHKYDRSVEIEWSPFSDLLALNDYVESDIAESFLIDPTFPERKIDLGERLAKSNRPRREKLSVETADHIYPHVTAWIDRDRLVFVTMGHGGIDAGGFTLSYLYSLRNNNFSLLEFDHHSEGGY